METEVRVSLYLPASAGPLMDRLCEERHLTRNALFRQALGVLHAIHDGTKDGSYVGITSDREALRIVLAIPV